MVCREGLQGSIFLVIYEIVDNKITILPPFNILLLSFVSLSRLPHIIFWNSEERAS